MTYLNVEEYDYTTSLKNYNFKTPLILRGFCKNTNAYKNWNTETMPKIFGTNKVEVECYLDEEDYKRGIVCDVSMMDMKEYIERIEKDERYYLAEIGLDEFDNPELDMDIYIKNDYLNNLNESEKVIFFGKNASSSCHFHIWQNYLLHQIIGKKTLYMFDFNDNDDQLKRGSPWDIYRKFTFWKHNDKILNMKDEEERKKLKLYKVTLEPGDSLMIPPWWYHDTTGHGLSCSITTKYDDPNMQSYLFKYFHILLCKICICFEICYYKNTKEKIQYIFEKLLQSVIGVIIIINYYKNINIYYLFVIIFIILNVISFFYMVLFK